MNQLPFSSINYGTCTLPEGRMVTKALLEGCIKGVGKFGRTSVFPCGIFQFSKEINGYPGTPNYDLFKLAIKSTVKRLYPNYANVEWSVNKAAIKYDRDVKTKYLNSLSDTDKLILKDFLARHTNIKDMLRLSISDEGAIVPVMESYPDEIMGTMGCRTYNGADINFGEVFEANIKKAISGEENEEAYINLWSAAQKDGRGNIVPETIILPTLAKECKDLNENVYKELSEKKRLDKSEVDSMSLIDRFMEYLDCEIENSKNSLIKRYKYICSQSPSSAAFMWDNKIMAGYVPEEGIVSAMKHGTLAIGQLGLAETLIILIGKDHTTEEGMELAKRIESLYAKRCKEYKNIFKLNFGVYYTPAENLSYTAMTKFKARFGKVPGVTTYPEGPDKGKDKTFFTNSIHVPVYHKVSVFDKVDIESKLTGYSSAGCITYVEFGDTAVNNERAVEQNVVYAMEHDIPYHAINVFSDTCNACGYQGVIPEGKPCPKCGETHDIDRLRRVTGYLTADYRKAFNKGKQDEADHRENHTDTLCNWKEL